MSYDDAGSGDYDDYYSLPDFDAAKFTEDDNVLVYGHSDNMYIMIISCMASKNDGSQDWMFLEKPFFTSITNIHYGGGRPHGFCECLQKTNAGKVNATTESIRNCYEQSLSGKMNNEKVTKRIEENSPFKLPK